MKGRIANERSELVIGISGKAVKADRVERLKLLRDVGLPKIEDKAVVLVPIEIP